MSDANAFPTPTRHEPRAPAGPVEQVPPPGARHVLSRKDALDAARAHLADWVADRDYAAEHPS